MMSIAISLPFNLNYRDAIISYYKTLGENLGFTVRENPSIIKHGINFGRINMIWLEPNVTITVEFGNFENILGHLWRILEYSPELAVLVLSSKSGCKASDVAKLVEQSELLENKQKKFLIIDVTDKKVVYAPRQG